MEPQKALVKKKTHAAKQTRKAKNVRNLFANKDTELVRLVCEKALNNFTVDDMEMLLDKSRLIKKVIMGSCHQMMISIVKTSLEKHRDMMNEIVTHAPDRIQVSLDSVEKTSNDEFARKINFLKYIDYCFDTNFPLRFNQQYGDAFTRAETLDLKIMKVCKNHMLLTLMNPEVATRTKYVIWPLKVSFVTKALPDLLQRNTEKLQLIVGKEHFRVSMLHPEAFMCFHKVLGEIFPAVVEREILSYF